MGKKVLALGLVVFMLGLIACQETPPEIEEEKTEEATGVTRDDLAIIETVHEEMNNAVGWDNNPDKDDASVVLNRRVPRLVELKEKIEQPKLREDIARLIDNLEKGGELASQGQEEEARDYWVIAHRISHDLDKVLLGNPVEDEKYWGYSEFLESLR